MTAKAKVEVILPQAKECQRLLSNHQNWEEAKKIPPLVPQVAWFYQHLGFRLLVFKTVRE
jgi:hypothetical protein